MSVLLPLLLSLPLLCSSLSSCPSLPSLRTPFVSSSFQVSLSAGMWWEGWLQDPAQAGSSCQFFNKTAVGEVDVREYFGFSYGRAQHMWLSYAGGEQRGLFNKTLERLPKGMIVPTVVVDVTTGQDGMYDTISEYSCYQIGPIVYEEIRLGSRTPTMSEEQKDSMVAVLEAQGIDTSRLKQADQNADCDYSMYTTAF
jgi:hypothetical protein